MEDDSMKEEPPPAEETPPADSVGGEQTEETTNEEEKYTENGNQIGFSILDVDPDGLLFPPQFTEKETIEAMKNLGYVPEDLIIPDLSEVSDLPEHNETRMRVQAELNRRRKQMFENILNERNLLIDIRDGKVVSSKIHSTRVQESTIKVEIGEEPAPIKTKRSKGKKKITRKKPNKVSTNRRKKTDDELKKDVENTHPLNAPLLRTDIKQAPLVLKKRKPLKEAPEEIRRKKLKKRKKIQEKQIEKLIRTKNRQAKSRIAQLEEENKKKIDEIHQRRLEHDRQVLKLKEKADKEHQKKAKKALQKMDEIEKRRKEAKKAKIEQLKQRAKQRQERARQVELNKQKQLLEKRKKFEKALKNDDKRSQKVLSENQKTIKRAFQARRRKELELAKNIVIPKVSKTVFETI